MGRTVGHHLPSDLPRGAAFTTLPRRVPVLPLLDFGDHALRHAELNAELPLELPLGVLADERDVGIGELAPWVLGAESPRGAPLGRPVTGVVGIGAHRQMGGIAALRHVTGVKDVHPVRDGAPRELESQTVSPVDRAIVREKTVPGIERAGPPNPAFIGAADIDARPKLGNHSPVVHGKNSSRHES